MEAMFNPKHVHIGEDTFFIGGRGREWAGASEGRVLSKFFTNWGGSNLFFCSSTGGGSQFFGKEKLLDIASILQCTSKATSEN